MKTDTYTEPEIIEGIKSQQSNVIYFLYEKNFKIVRQFVENNNGSIDDVKDVFQDSIMLLYLKIKEGKLVLKGSIHAYLIGITKFTWLHSLEKSKKITHDSIPDSPDYENFYDDLIKTERKRMFMNHFKDLPESCQKLISLFIKNYQLQEITRIMGYGSDQYTRNKKIRCKKSLLDKIVQDPYFKNKTNEKIGKYHPLR